MLATDSPLERNLFDTSESVRVKEVGDFWLLGQCDGVVLSPHSAFADRALSMAMHTQLIVRCAKDKIRHGRVIKPVHKFSKQQEEAKIKILELNVTPPIGWDCRYVQLKDGPAFPGAF